MKMVTRSVVVAAIFIFLCSGIALGADQKIGILDIQKVVLESKAGKEAGKAFEDELAGTKSKLGAKQKEVSELQVEINSLKPEARKDKEAKLAGAKAELEKMQKDLRGELRQRDRDLAINLIKESYTIARKIGEERKFTLILRSNPQVVYADKSTDITAEVIKRYDAQYDAAKKK